MARVEPFVAGLERLVARDAPAGIGTRERNGVAGIDGQHRRQVAREVAVQRTPLERDLVNHERGAPTQASFGASSTRRPARLPSSKYSSSDTACHPSASRPAASSAGT